MSYSQARRSQPMVFVENLDHPVIESDDHHHLAKALRVPDGAAVTVSDGKGRWCSVRFAPAANGAVAEPVSEIIAEPPAPWELAVAFAPVKGERPEWTVQKLTELGIDRIIPIMSQRSVVRWDASRWAKQEQKWKRIAREASMQSRRVWLPVIESLTAFSDLGSSVGGSSANVVLADPDGVPLEKTDRLVVIGPEGGWDDNETSGCRLVALPGGVLRAETAALTAASIMALHRDRDRSNLK